jgi:hypothetical protein
MVAKGVQQEPTKKLGKAPAKSNVKALMLAHYMKRAAVPAPRVYNFWAKRKEFPIRDIGNNEWGNCTIASQILLSQRMERLEQIKTVLVPKENIVQTYLSLTERLYGGGDTGAYESDALDNWRNPQTTFKDVKGRPFTIDAYVRVNHFDVEEIKRAVHLSGSQGIKVCFNLPLAWSMSNVWDIPVGQKLINEYVPGSWGGHSMTAVARWDENWLWMPSSWNMPDTKISWRAFAIYCDEAYIAIDSINSWKKKRAVAKILDLTGIRNDVNAVSSIQISK